MAVEQTEAAPVETDGEAAMMAALEEHVFGGGQANKPRDPATGKFTRDQAQSEAPAAEQGTDTDQETVGEDTVQQPEEVEVEIEGERYLVPKKISDRFIQHADYTRKTQDLAELRRATSAERETFSLNKAFDQSVATERQRLAALEEQIEQYKRVDWQSLETEQLLKARAAFDQLKDMRAELADAIKAKRGDFDQRISQHVQEAMQAGEKYISQRIKGFNDDVKNEILSYGTAEGYTKAELDRIMDPRIVVSLHKAMQWDKLQASKPETLNRASQAQPTVRPGASQRPVSRIQSLNKAFTQAKPGKAKENAAVDYFTAKFRG
jgi:hypothetical protein